MLGRALVRSFAASGRIALLLTLLLKSGGRRPDSEVTRAQKDVPEAEAPEMENKVPFVTDGPAHYVRVDNPTSHLMSWQEIEVMSGGQNLVAQRPELITATTRDGSPALNEAKDPMPKRAWSALLRVSLLPY